MKVNILMSTYNGEKYVGQQIESIQKQTFTEWNLLVRDDGSKDKTCDIVNSYAQNDKRIQLFQAENKGVIESFYDLAKSSQADYYFFCDQDDFWLSDKMQIVLDEASKHDNEKAKLYYTDLKIVNKDLQVLNESMIRSQSNHANTKLVQELTENSVTGCTMVANHALIELWKNTSDIIMHDWYLALLAAAQDGLIYIDQATILYRQHDSNVLGARTFKKRIKKWLRPHLWFKKYWWLIVSSQKQAEKLLTDVQLSKENRELVQSYASILEQSRKTRYVWIKKYNLRKNKSGHTLIFRGLLITKFAYKAFLRTDRTDIK
ncbi:glycosyltransferase family 2 protein [Lactococcus garvieae]|uniref:glycosyltransferase family 2 protein n=1 Tax=Lactococcus garvieae TaxID=1363 RepID=UPI0018D6E302|nr:glycosyltransferase family 2 protein [Lactococcus garvieae]QPS70932.1 glycosyltransferase family 2 protein [Lactococcus garvieae]